MFYDKDWNNAEWLDLDQDVPTSSNGQLGTQTVGASRGRKSPPVNRRRLPVRAGACYCD